MSETATTVTRIKASQHESYWTFTIIALLMPLIGIILGVVYLTKDTKLDRKLGEHLVAISALFMILWGMLYFLTLFPGIFSY